MDFFFENFEFAKFHGYCQPPLSEKRSKMRFFLVWSTLEWSSRDQNFRKNRNFRNILRDTKLTFSCSQTMKTHFSSFSNAETFISDGFASVFLGFAASQLLFFTVFFLLAAAIVTAEWMRNQKKSRLTRRIWLNSQNDLYFDSHHS